MRRASQLLSPSDRRDIELAATEAERRSSSEIFVVLATRSERYERAEDIFGMLFSLGCLSAFWALFQVVGWSGSPWNGGVDLPSLVTLLVVSVAGFVLGTRLAARYPRLARALIPKRRLTTSFFARADESFGRYLAQSTKPERGLLLFVSLFERRVFVREGQEVADRLDPSAFAGVKDVLVAGFRNGDPARSIVRALDRCGDILATALPPEEPRTFGHAHLHLVD